jgi:uncharacterized phiE125 gp8 family phage protein
VRTDRLTLIRTAAPTVEPVTLAEFREHARIDPADTSSTMDAYLTTAREHCEQVTRRAFITQTWRLRLDEFPKGDAGILLPRPRLLSVASIVYTDGDGVDQTLSADKYAPSLDDEPAMVYPAPTILDWPTTRTQRNAVAITYVAGYGAAAADVPRPIRQAILLLASHWYENREPVLIGTINGTLPFTVDALLSPYICREVW